MLSPMRRTAGALRFRLRALGLEQAFLLLACGLRILLGRLRHPRGAERDAREAEQLAATLGALKGPFAKVGQFASLRIDVLPPAVRQGLSAVRDRVPPLPSGWVRELLEAELGCPLEECFASFDPEPLGAASIAQVHRARLRDGTQVAVKVQYPWLQGSLGADLGLLRLCLWLGAPGGRPGATRQRLFEEFAAGVYEELDFEREARVAQEIAANLADETQIVVPGVVTSHSSARILTMEYFSTLPITDAGTLARRGVSAAEVLEIVVRAYARQVFVDGLFHADPHPGNLFVLDEPDVGRRPRVLFVDFGLSKRLEPELRTEMRSAIFAMLQGDLEAFLEGMGRLEMIEPGAEPGVREAVEAMFQRLRGEGVAPLGIAGDRVLALKDEAKQLLSETGGLRLPNDLLLYAKTVSYLFGLGAELAPEVDVMKLSVPYLLRFLASSPAGAPGGG